MVREHRAGRLRSPPPLAVGTRLAFVARFLGRRLEYTYEVREHVEPAGFAKVGAALLARAMARANRADLDRLKQILEG